MMNSIFIAAVDAAKIVVYVLAGIGVGISLFELIRIIGFGKTVNSKIDNKCKDCKAKQALVRAKNQLAQKDKDLDEKDAEIAYITAAKEKELKALRKEKDEEIDLIKEKANAQMSALRSENDDLRKGISNAGFESAAADSSLPFATALALSRANKKAEDADAAFTLRESLATAYAVGAVGTITKKSVIKYLTEKYGDGVIETNARANRTAPGRGQEIGLPLADTHYAFTEEDKKICFTYVYEKEGKVLLLVRLDQEYARKVADNHSKVMHHSRFPKNKMGDWYSLAVDDSFSEQGIYDILDQAIAYIRGEDISEGLTLHESLAAAHSVGAVGTVSKRSVIDYLSEKYSYSVVINSRPNRAPAGKGEGAGLLLADTHYTDDVNGKSTCFTYVYEDEDGKILLLVRLDKEYADMLSSSHHRAVYHSRFPKNTAKDWYSVLVDGSFSEAGVYGVLDKAISYIRGEHVDLKNLTLSESLAGTQCMNYDEKNLCFACVYESDDKVLLLVRPDKVSDKELTEKDICDTLVEAINQRLKKTQ